MIGIRRKLLISFLLIFLLGGNEMVIARDLYAEAFTHFLEEVISESYKDSDTLCIKQTFGITDFFPKEIKGHPIRLVNEFDCENIPKNTYVKGITFIQNESDGSYKKEDVSYYVYQIYYIYPMTINFIQGDLRISVEISCALYWEKDKREMRDPSANDVYSIFFIYNKKTNEVEYSGMSGGFYSGPIPWIFDD